MKVRTKKDRPQAKSLDFEALQDHCFLLQISDSVFPIGAYSHSFGLETYVQKGLVHDTDSSLKFISAWFKNSFLYTDLLAVSLAYNASLHQQWAELDALEAYLEASRIPMELREASRKLGNRFCKLLATITDPEKHAFFHDYLEHRQGKVVCHPVAYGLFCSELAVDKAEVLLRFSYAQASAMVTNAVKAIPLSQTDGQKILVALYPLLGQLLQEVEELTIDDLCASTPAFDLRSMEHEHVYSRLYMS